MVDIFTLKVGDRVFRDVYALAVVQGIFADGGLWVCYCEADFHFRYRLAPEQLKWLVKA
jgi:hypothetical protein